MPKTAKLNRSEIIRASEIAQYGYCSVGWFLQRCGIAPAGESLQKGSDVHAKIGEKIDTIQYKERISKQMSIIGYVLLFIAFVIFVWSWLL